jgi:hypothetical protein
MGKPESLEFGVDGNTAVAGVGLYTLLVVDLAFAK